MIQIRNILALFFLLVVVACSTEEKAHATNSTSSVVTVSNEQYDEKGLAKAYFASGCFWCVEAVFESVKGVKEAVSGYSGGAEKNPTYRLVSSGNSRHAEAVEVIYDPKVIDYETLLVVFFDSHDATTLNRQGPDRGPQYRSAIFYQNAEEKKMANAYIKKLQAKMDKKIVTEVSELDIFYKAEDYHQDYERNHPTQGYIQAVSIPRLNRFKAKHPELLKEEEGH